MDEFAERAFDLTPWTAESLTKEMVDQFAEAFPGYGGQMTPDQYLDSVGRWYTNLGTETMAGPRTPVGDTACDRQCDS